MFEFDRTHRTELKKKLRKSNTKYRTNYFCSSNSNTLSNCSNTLIFLEFFLKIHVVMALEQLGYTHPKKIVTGFFWRRKERTLGTKVSFFARKSENRQRKNNLLWRKRKEKKTQSQSQNQAKSFSPTKRRAFSPLFFFSHWVSTTETKTTELLLLSNNSTGCMENLKKRTKIDW